MDITKKLEIYSRMDEGKLKDFFKKLGDKVKGVAKKAGIKIMAGELRDLFKMGETPERVYSHLALSHPDAQALATATADAYSSDKNFKKLAELIKKKPFK